MCANVQTVATGMQYSPPELDADRNSFPGNEQLKVPACCEVASI